MGDSLHIHKVDVDQQQELAMQQWIQAMPTLLLFKDGQLVEKMVGFSTAEEMAEVVKPYL